MAQNRKSLKYLLVVGLLLGTQSAKYFSHSWKPLSHDELTQLEQPMGHRSHHHHHDQFNLQTEADNMIGERSAMRSQSRSRAGHQVSADDFDYNTSNQDDEYDNEKHIEEIKKYQNDFLQKQNNYQKETLERIDKVHNQINQELEATRAREDQRQKDLLRQEEIEKVREQKNEEKNVNDLFKSIVHEETNKRQELEQTLFGKTSEQKSKPAAKPQAKASASPAAPAAEQKKDAHNEGAASPSLLQKEVPVSQPIFQKAKSVTSPKKVQSLVQAATNSQTNTGEYVYDPVEHADLTKFDVGVTYDDTLVQSSKPKERNYLYENEADGDDIDEDALNPVRSYDEQAAVLENQDFMMNLDDDHENTLLQYDYSYDECGPYTD